MSKFRRSNKPRIYSTNTASVPDLVFTLLFFFIILSNVGDETPPVKVKLEEPVATAYNAKDKKAPHIYIYIGKAIENHSRENHSNEKETNTCIQINGQWVTLPEIKSYFLRIKSGHSLAEQAQMTVFIRADKDTPMHVIHAIEKILREVGVLKINYAVRTNH
ncbi:MAG: biopolymer transporter ExbD [Dysgonamonadaceae bacterium]|jgi:biopolymer transport protein ExbD|nr:biopolymer transporter ExbD [Dysgonamonadaceae bacterium]